MKAISSKLILLCALFLFFNGVNAQSPVETPVTEVSQDVAVRQDSSMAYRSLKKGEAQSSSSVVLSPEEAAEEDAARKEVRNANRTMIAVAVGAGVALVVFMLSFVMAGGK